MSGVYKLDHQRFAVVGAGRVGLALAVLLREAGHRIIGCSARTSASLERAARYLNCFSSTHLEDVVAGADCVVIAVADDDLPGVGKRLAAAGLPAGTKVFHVSGSAGLEPLRPVEEAGADILAMHVLQSVPDVESGKERIPGSWFGVTCADHLRPWAEALVGDLDGKIHWLSEDERTLYHAGAVIASNYLVVLAALAQKTSGIIEPYLPLMRGTLQNIEQFGPEAALTGPIARGDVGTVRDHLDKLGTAAPEVLDPYRRLGMALLSMVQDLDDQVRDELAQILGEQR